jgi:hypothetical protein
MKVQVSGSREETSNSQKKRKCRSEWESDDGIGMLEIYDYAKDGLVRDRFLCCVVDVCVGTCPGDEAANVAI